MNNDKKYSQHFKKFNLGCGDKLYKDFLNIGYWSALESGGLYKDLNGSVGTFMLNHDLVNGIPAEDNSLDLIYHSHMLEHLSYEDGINFIKECYRTLKPNGRMRILVPDLELWINAYSSKNRFFFEQYRKILNSDIYVTNASIFMGMLHNHEHKCGYDFESLSWVLGNAGFIEIEKKLYADSQIEGIIEIEPSMPLRTMESLCVECIK
jgi:predicted SAM-dependent methyltransferase